MGTWRPSRHTPPPTGMSPGSAAAAGRWPIPGRDPASCRPRPDPRLDRPVYPGEPRRSHRVGQLEGARSGGDHRRDPGPPRWPGRAGRGRSAIRGAPGGGDIPRGGPAPGQHAGRARCRAAGRAGRAPCAGRDPLAGRGRDAGGRGGRVHHARECVAGSRPASSVRCGGSGRLGAEQVESLLERRDRTAIGRYAPTSVKLMLDGIVENFTAAFWSPIWTPMAARRRTAV